jgi:hypothetical protein
MLMQGSNEQVEALGSDGGPVLGRTLHSGNGSMWNPASPGRWCYCVGELTGACQWPAPLSLSFAAALARPAGSGATLAGLEVGQVTAFNRRLLCVWEWW